MSASRGRPLIVRPAEISDPTQDGFGKHSLMLARDLGCGVSHETSERNDPDKRLMPGNPMDKHSNPALWELILQIA